ncbi:MAG: J domain-containing protein [Treponema sp.]|nr:J domain-containing protein [Treponema sp.]
MPSMFDKLGDLLNETLEAGYVKYVRVEDDESEEKTSFNESRADSEKREQGSAFNSEKTGSDGTGKTGRDRVEPRGYDRVEPRTRRYKKITPQIQAAFRFLGITVSASLEDAKKAYKEKLMYYHPDRNNKSEVMKKVATQKTKQVIDSYRIVTEFLSE